MKLILASNNKNKLLEFKEILAGTGIEVTAERGRLPLRGGRDGRHF